MNKIQTQLISTVGKDRVVVDEAVMAGYTSDEASWSESGTPTAVVRAIDRNDVVSTMLVANRHGVPVVARGSGSGLSGGANAIEGCIILSFTGMDRIIEINDEDQLAVVEPGVINGALKAAVHQRGLWFPPDPASSDFCTIGGNVATNAGGLCCVKYGATRDYVLALEVVLGNGEVVSVGGRTPRSAAGYDVAGLFVGSEGTLGLVTEITVRLRPIPPPPVTAAAFFPTTNSAGAAIDLIRHSGVRPSVVEIMDQTTIRAVESWKRLDLDQDAAVLLLVQADEREADRDNLLSLIEQSCSKANATSIIGTADPDEGARFLEARKIALPALERLGNTILDDVAVPCSQLAALIDSIEEIASRHDLQIGCFGHAGVGNLHPTIIMDPDDEGSEVRARAAFDELVGMAIRCGGTITGEHGVGSLKTRFLAAELGTRVHELQAGIKKLFDPSGILNPGKAI